LLYGLRYYTKHYAQFRHGAVKLVSDKKRQS